MNIPSLLNPTASMNALRDETRASTSPVSTADTTTVSSASLTPRAKHRKFVHIDNIVQQFKYPPHEYADILIHLSHAEQQELERYQITWDPEDKSRRLIQDHPAHVPYSSEKKNFGGKTIKNGFDTFSYKFRVSSNSNGVQIFEVIWDYDSGLVRTTPFFRACEQAKTVPNKALIANPGLKELSYSITGGALKAQGYWIPYDCARAICATFCYDIRLALTPIFGPSFARECLRSTDPGYKLFSIDRNIVRHAQREAETAMASPNNGPRAFKEVPRSVPQAYALGTGKATRPRVRKTMFKDSPFASESDTLSTRSITVNNSPEISPKTLYGSPGWTAINRAHTMSAPSMINSLSRSALMESHYPFWAPDDLEHENESETGMSDMQASVRGKQRVNKRRRSSDNQAYAPCENKKKGIRYSDDGSGSESEEDDIDIPLPKSSFKNVPRQNVSDTASAMSGSTLAGSGIGPKSRKYHTQEVRAAKILVAMSNEDAKLRTGPKGPASQRGQF